MAIDTIEKALYSRLTNFAGLSALISDRVYPGALPQNCDKPAVYYEEYSGGYLQTNSGDMDLRPSSFRVYSVADTYSEMKAVSKQVELALERWNQSTPVPVHDSLIESTDDFYVDDMDEHLSEVDITIWHEGC